MYSFFMNTMKQIINEEKEQRKKENNELVQTIKKIKGKCPQATKEFIDSYGIKGYSHVEGWNNHNFPNQYFIFNVTEMHELFKTNYVVSNTPVFTYEEALKIIYKNIESYISNYEGKHNGHVQVSFNDDLDNKLMSEIEVVYYNKDFVIERIVYNIHKQLITINPDSQFILPTNDRNVNSIYDL